MHDRSDPADAAALPSRIRRAVPCSCPGCNTLPPVPLPLRQRGDTPFRHRSVPVTPAKCSRCIISTVLLSMVAPPGSHNENSALPK
ncbi:hypothetical protein [Geobacter sulfurreducens]|uniref:hypothetical protein n=1 Tax=Geobacter sulfurreducens TaxID=35554 RepID=UPI00257345D5|nr:hypothetical protein [Geobacter sulfurreducens]